MVQCHVTTTLVDSACLDCVVYIIEKKLGLVTFREFATFREAQPFDNGACIIMAPLSLLIDKLIVHHCMYLIFKGIL